MKLIIKVNNVDNIHAGSWESSPGEQIGKELEKILSDFDYFKIGKESIDLDNNIVVNIEVK